MNEREIFLALLDLPEEKGRASFLDGACGGDDALRARVEMLLRSHDSAGSFLGRAEVEVPDHFLAATRLLDGGEIPAEGANADDVLSFLSPSGRPGSLGRLGHYEVLEILGRGGFGIVFRAFDEVLQRVVAMKVLAPHLAATSPPRKRFLREARSSAAIRHENVVQVYSVGEQPLPYLTMEFIPGETLQERIDRTGPLEIAEVAHFGRQIAEGLDAAHARGLIHRDIKPGNILIDAGPQPRAKITDFGLARAAEDASLTQSGVLAGTPMYMAPEQATGGAIDPRADLFSLGSVLYVMCSGRPPFRASNTLAVLKRVVEDTPRPIREVIPEVPEWLCELISGLHAKDPADRTATAREVADRLGRRIEELQGPRTVPIAPRVLAFGGGLETRSNEVDRLGPAIRPLRARHRLWAGAVAAVLTLLCGGLGLAEATGVTDLRGTVIRLFSPEGTLVVEVDDPGVIVKVDGSDISITGAGAREIRLKPGRYTVEATKAGKLVGQELVNVARDGKQVVRISREAPPRDVKPAEATVNPSAWERSVAELPADERAEAVLARLKEINPGINIIRNDKGLDLLVSGPGLREISPLRAMPGLHRLHLDAANLDDISPLKGLALTRLDLFSTRVSDLSPLRGMGLISLDLTFSARCSDLSPLGGLALEALTIHGTGIVDLSPLSGMKLKYLNGNSSNVSDLSPLKGMPLTLLYLKGSKVTDLAPIEGLPLEKLVCDFRARDASILRAIRTLKTINDRPADEFWKEVGAPAGD